MPLSLSLVTLVVAEYDEAIAFFTQILDFDLVEDTPVPEQGKRWVVVKPPGPGNCGLLLARASNPDQGTRVGNQTGGRVAFFLHTDDLARDHARFRSRGVEFVREPTQQAFGKAAVFRDLYGNLWDLVEHESGKNA